MKEEFLLGFSLIVVAVTAPGSIPHLLGLIVYFPFFYVFWIVFKDGPSAPSQQELWLLNRRLPAGKKVGLGEKPPRDWRRLVEEEQINLSKNIWLEADALYPHGSGAWTRHVDREVMLWLNELQRIEEGKACQEINEKGFCAEVLNINTVGDGQDLLAGSGPPDE